MGKQRTPKDCAADALAVFEEACYGDCAGKPFPEKIEWRKQAVSQLQAWLADRVTELQNEQIDSTVTSGEPNKEDGS